MTRSKSISTEAMNYRHRKSLESWKSGLVVMLALLLGACGLTAPRGDEGYAKAEVKGGRHCA